MARVAGRFACQTCTAARARAERTRLRELQRTAETFDLAADIREEHADLNYANLAYLLNDPS